VAHEVERRLKLIRNTGGPPNFLRGVIFLGVCRRLRRRTREQVQLGNCIQRWQISAIGLHLTCSLTPWMKVAFFSARVKRPPIENSEAHSLRGVRSPEKGKVTRPGEAQDSMETTWPSASGTNCERHKIPQRYLSRTVGGGGGRARCFCGGLHQSACDSPLDSRVSAHVQLCRGIPETPPEKKRPHVGRWIRYNGLDGLDVGFPGRPKRCITCADREPVNSPISI